MTAASTVGDVLVVDDNAENRALAEATLDDEGYRVVLASSGAEALDRIAAERFDCVLLDIRMPGMDGIEVCRRIRATGGVDLPILFLTAQRDVDTFDRAREAGGDDYITKPIRPSELVARVASAVKQHRMALERGELYDVVRRQRDDLMRLQLAKEALSAFVVHDLKNPVHTIDLLGQRLVRDKAGSEHTRDIGLRVRDEASALLRMITNLLDLSKADAGSLTAKRVQLDVAELIADVVGTMRVRAQTASVALVAEVGPALALVADPDLLRRLLENLVDNAIRHAPEDTTVTASARDDGTGVELRIADRGAGVPAELRERVFERFVQSAGDSGRSNRGLGLSFCKLAVEAHGGRIWIEDGEPGAVFCTWIPHAPQ